MRYGSPLIALALLTGCGGGEEAGNNSATADAPAVTLMNEEAAEADNAALAPLPEPAADMTAPDAALPGIDAPPLAPRAQPTATPTPEAGRADAARVVRAYYARITRGDYAAARAMWDDDGEASGLTPADYAKRFDRFAEFRAEIGTPGRIDAGAGQRYVEVPVTVTARMKESGEVVERRGIVTLHRTGDIEGATPAQRRWRIASAEILPKPPAAPAAEVPPTAAPAADAIVTARYACEGGVRLIARFDNAKGEVTLRRGYRVVGTLRQQPVGSGIAYKGEDGLELRGKGDAATVTLPGGAPFACEAR
ncbi:hypothetical protein COC42_07785 [Sphingomonas spermidinifaciens]|uniref:C-type lysozyme inhibitor domain-containing protein n=1 Tax=Sphingomonas spermidinifaciens TaxID=1141889 RepID=A0A2A4B8A7_9SPHN|nr:MliC family protein [Sphingomonas spermidinifaciens]PCD04182.1 hypothetical protein COC42_07785 [Sphingomonas spermidinifaciens]